MVEHVRNAAPGGLLKVKDASLRLGVSSSTVYRLVEARKIPCIRLGMGRGCVRFDPADLDAYLAACRVEVDLIGPTLAVLDARAAARAQKELAADLAEIAALSPKSRRLAAAGRPARRGS